MYFFTDDTDIGNRSAPRGSIRRKSSNNKPGNTKLFSYDSNIEPVHSNGFSSNMVSAESFQSCSSVRFYDVHSPPKVQPAKVIKCDSPFGLFDNVRNSREIESSSSVSVNGGLANISEAKSDIGNIITKMSKLDLTDSVKESSCVTNTYDHPSKIFQDLHYENDCIDSNNSTLELQQNNSTFPLELQQNNSTLDLQQNISTLDLQQNNSTLDLQQNNSTLDLQQNNSTLLNVAGQCSKEACKDVPPTAMCTSEVN